MMEVGTPAIKLEPYVAPVFIGSTTGVVTDITFQNTGTSTAYNVPVAFGHVFAEGDLAPSTGLIGRNTEWHDIALQVDAKSTHFDGSVRHALISAMLPRVLTESTMQLVRVPSKPAATVPFSTVSCEIEVVENGILYKAKNSKQRTWRDGHACHEEITHMSLMGPDGAPHPVLFAVIDVTDFSNNHRVDVTLEHSDPYKALGDLTYDVVIKIDGKEYYNQTKINSPVHFKGARWRKEFWTNGIPPVHIKHNVPYLIGTKQVPNYDQNIKISESALQKCADDLAHQDYGPMGTGSFTKAMGTTGGRPDIGLAPSVYAMAVLSMDKRAKDLMLAMGNCGGSWGVHFRSKVGPSAGMPLDIIHYKAVTIMGHLPDSYNRSTGMYEKFPAATTSSTSRNYADAAHQPAFSYIPWLLTGDYFHLEELQFWANFSLIKNNPGYRMWERGLTSRDELRGQAWALRTLFQAAVSTPDNHPSKSAFMYWVNENLDFANASYTDNPKANKLGFNEEFETVVYNNRTGLSPWQDDFYAQAMGMGNELGFKKAGKFMGYKARFVVGRMMDPGFCWIDAAMYSMQVRDAYEAPFYDTFDKTYRVSTNAAIMVAGPCNSQARLDYINSIRPMPSNPLLLNEMQGYSYSPMGYPSNMQPALAYAVDNGFPGAAEAWTKFSGRAVQPNYGVSPQFAIVPRNPGTSTATPVPPVTTTPTPVPPITTTPTPVPPGATSPPLSPTPTPTPTPVPIVKTVTVTITSPELKGLKLLRVSIYDVSTLRCVSETTGRSAGVNGSITINDADLVAGIQYAVIVADSTKKILVGSYPVRAV
jgi:hypothetical protein